MSSRNGTGYISVRNWRRFQHYRDRNPPWVKNYTELLSDEAYLALPGGTRSVLHGLWLAYASSRARLSADTGSLTRRLNLRVTKRQLEVLVQAGFIEIVDSAPLADGYHAASTTRAREEAEAETEEEAEVKPSTTKEEIENFNSLVHTGEMLRPMH
jgi:hypothetical protein